MHDGPQTVRERVQQFISDVMPQGVIDLLEAVQVEKQQQHRKVVIAGRDELFKILVQCKAIG